MRQNLSNPLKKSSHLTTPRFNFSVYPIKLTLERKLPHRDFSESFVAVLKYSRAPPEVRFTYLHRPAMNLKVPKCMDSEIHKLSFLKYGYKSSIYCFPGLVVASATAG